ncbi:MAG: copper resistance protein NlpE [Prevotellaceae bacterium]|jgi:uncharacterized lipoprotein NlpE involved in copper resistance|nr:copper resistance protein NlpE [Prevotellaceae bacterium]
MKKIYLFVLVAGLMLAGCKSSNKTKDEASTETKKEAVSNMHNARNSLDYKGIYKGVLPCADCSGIETTLTLNDNDYIMVMKYLSKEEYVYTEKGTYKWKNGNTIILQGDDDGPTQYIVGENMLKQLDQDGNVITGPLADLYILKKQ